LRVVTAATLRVLIRAVGLVDGELALVAIRLHLRVCGHALVVAVNRRPLRPYVLARCDPAHEALCLGLSLVTSTLLDDEVAAEHDAVQADATQELFLRVLAAVVQELLLAEVAVLDLLHPVLGRSCVAAARQAVALDEAAGDSVGDVLQEEVGRDLVHLAAQYVALQLDLQDQGAEKDDVVWSAHILQDVLVDVVLAELVESLLKAALVELPEVLVHEQAREHAALHNELALLEIQSSHTGATVLARRIVTLYRLG
jgi:hypothetical protein